MESIARFTDQDKGLLVMPDGMSVFGMRRPSKASLSPSLASIQPTRPQKHFEISPSSSKSSLPRTYTQSNASYASTVIPSRSSTSLQGGITYQLPGPLLHDHPDTVLTISTNTPLPTPQRKRFFGSTPVHAASNQTTTRPPASAGLPKTPGTPGSMFSLVTPPTPDKAPNRRRGSAQLLNGLGKGLNRMGSVMKRSGGEPSAPATAKNSGSLSRGLTLMRASERGRKVDRPKTMFEAQEFSNESREFDEVDGDAGISRPFGVDHDMHLGADFAGLAEPWLEELKAKGLSDSDLLLIAATRSKQRSIPKLQVAAETRSSPVLISGPMTPIQVHARAFQSGCDAPAFSGNHHHHQSDSVSTQATDLQTPKHPSPYDIQTTPPSQRSHRLITSPRGGLVHHPYSFHSPKTPSRHRPSNIKVPSNSTTKANHRLSDQLRGFASLPVGAGDSWAQDLLSAMDEKTSVDGLSLDTVAEDVVDSKELMVIEIPSSGVDTNNNTRKEESPPRSANSLSSIKRVPVPQLLPALDHLGRYKTSPIPSPISTGPFPAKDQLERRQTSPVTPIRSTPIASKWSKSISKASGRSRADSRDHEQFRKFVTSPTSYTFDLISSPIDDNDDSAGVPTLKPTAIVGLSCVENTSPTGSGDGYSPTSPHEPFGPVLPDLGDYEQDAVFWYEQPSTPRPGYIPPLPKTRGRGTASETSSEKYLSALPIGLGPFARQAIEVDRDRNTKHSSLPASAKTDTSVYPSRPPSPDISISPSRRRPQHDSLQSSISLSMVNDPLAGLDGASREERASIALSILSGGTSRDSNNSLRDLGAASIHMAYSTRLGDLREVNEGIEEEDDDDDDQDQDEQDDDYASVEDDVASESEDHQGDGVKARAIRVTRSPALSVLSSPVSSTMSMSTSGRLQRSADLAEVGALVALEEAARRIAGHSRGRPMERNRVSPRLVQGME